MLSQLFQRPPKGSKDFIQTQRLLLALGMFSALAAFAEIAVNHRQPHGAVVILMLYPVFLIAGYSHLGGRLRKMFTGVLALIVPVLIWVALR